MEGEGGHGGQRDGRGYGGDRGGFGGGNRNFGGPREMHKATCTDCGAECEVPFAPTPGKPVRCQDCFKKSRPPRFGPRRY